MFYDEWDTKKRARMYSSVLGSIGESNKYNLLNNLMKDIKIVIKEGLN